MQKMTVSEYARLNNKSVQAVYQMIEKQKIRAEKIDGKTFVYAEKIEADTQKGFKSDLNEVVKKENEMLKELLKSKQDEIETLKASLNVFTVVFNNRLNEKPTVTEAEIVKTGKKKKKKKR